MPHDTLEDLVIEALRNLLKDSSAISPDTLISEVAKSARVPAEAVIRAIWRLADLDEIEFREGRLVAIGKRARTNENHASAA